MLALTDLDNFPDVLEALKKYHEQLHADSLKKKQNNEFFFELDLYDLLKVQIIKSINAFISAEKTKQNEIESELQKYAIAEKAWAMGMHTAAEENKKLQQKMQENNDMIQQLQKYAEQHVKILDNHIAKVEAFIKQIKITLVTQKTNFLEQFQEETKAKLIDKYGDASIAVEVGSEKILLNMQEVLDMISLIAKAEFSRNIYPGSAEFKEKVQNKLEKLLMSRITEEVNRDPVRIQSAVAEITETVASKRSVDCEKMYTAYKMQCNELDIAENCLQVLKSIKAEEDAIVKNLTVAAPQSDLEKYLAQLKNKMEKNSQQVAKLSQRVDQGARDLSLLAHYGRKQVSLPKGNFNKELSGKTPPKLG